MCIPRKSVSKLYPQVFIKTSSSESRGQEEEILSCIENGDAREDDYSIKVNVAVVSIQ